jgi:hypothetical protein
MALAVPREAINVVTMTENTHFCCGKTLRVVEVEFADDATISLQDLFSQINIAASATAERMMGHADLRRRLTHRPGVRDHATGARNRPFLWG